MFLSYFIPFSFHLYLHNFESWKQLKIPSGNYQKKVQRIKLTKFISWCLSDKAGNASCFPSKQSEEEEPCVGVKIAQNKGGQHPLFLCFLFRLFLSPFDKISSSDPWESTIYWNCWCMYGVSDEIFSKKKKVYDLL